MFQTYSKIHNQTFETKYKVFNLILLQVKTRVFFSEFNLLASSTNLLHEILNCLILNKLSIYLKKKKIWFYNYARQTYVYYHIFTMEVSLLQVINTKMNTKTLCSSKVVVQCLKRKFLQFYKEYFINLTRWRHWKLSDFVKF